MRSRCSRRDPAGHLLGRGPPCDDLEVDVNVFEGQYVALTLGRLQSGDQVWYLGPRHMGEREGCPVVLRGDPTAWRQHSVNRDRQFDELAQHAFDSVPKQPVLLKKVHGDLAHALEILKQAAGKCTAS